MTMQGHVLRKKHKKKNNPFSSEVLPYVFDSPELAPTDFVSTTRAYPKLQKIQKQRSG